MTVRTCKIVPNENDYGCTVIFYENNNFVHSVKCANLKSARLFETQYVTGQLNPLLLNEES